MQGLQTSPIKCLFLAITATLLLVSTALADSFVGKLVKVVDGDTVDVLKDGAAERIRLKGVDCPELGQAFGNKAKQYVLEIAAGHIVAVEIITKDRYGRTVGEIFLPDGRSLNQELVRSGLAWWYRKYSDDQTLAALETDARKARRGLWFEDGAVAPWDFRKSRKKQ